MKMKAFCLSAVFSVISSSALAASTTGDAQVIIRQGIGIQQTQAMNFGVIDHDGTAQAVSMTAAGVVSCGTYTCTAGIRQNATFDVTGGTGATINVAAVAGTLSDGAGNTITITPVLASATLTGAGATAVNLDVGANLGTIAANKPAGLYSTSNSGGLPYVVTVNY